MSTEAILFAGIGVFALMLIGIVLTWRELHNLTADRTAGKQINRGQLTS
jgi:hypothetical protein